MRGVERFCIHKGIAAAATGLMMVKDYLQTLLIFHSICNPDPSRIFDKLKIHSLRLRLTASNIVWVRSFCFSLILKFR
jgi:hypothetical protein